MGEGPEVPDPKLVAGSVSAVMGISGVTAVPSVKERRKMKPN